jgi:hypothetical protein
MRPLSKTSALKPVGAAGAGVGLVRTELFGVVRARWRLHRHCGRRTTAVLPLWLLAPTTATFAKTLLLSGEHLVLVGGAVVGAYLMAIMAIGSVNWSTAASLRQKQSIA